MTTRTYRIDAANLTAFVKKMSALSRKATKLGCTAVGFEQIGAGVEMECLACGRVSDTNPICACAAKTRFWSYVEVAVFGQAPSFNGWTFAATLERVGDANLVRSIADVELPESYRTAAPKCEHCKLSRVRRDTFVMLHEDGRTIQVGRQCIRDFLGHESPQQIAEQARFIASLRGAGDEDEDAFGCGGRTSYADGLVDVLAFAVRDVAEHGYITKAAAEARCSMSTSNAVFHMVHPIGDDPVPSPATKAELSKAAEIVAYFSALAPSSDFEHNVVTIAKAGCVEAKHYGYAVSLVCAYERAMGREAIRRQERNAAAVSSYFGTIGKREIFTLTVLKVLDFESQFGVTHMHLFVDGAGNVAKWMASSERLEVGQTYDVKGTVKAHEEYKGSKQTMLTRCAASLVKAVAS